MINDILVPRITNITDLKKNPVELSKFPETCVLSNGRPSFYAASPERMAELLDSHEALSRVTRSIHLMYEGGLINWAVMDTLQASIDGLLDKEMPF